MADWRQIRGRIRRAKSGPDAVTRLEQLFDKTRDGMVAFELAQLEEVSGRIERAIDWYKRAWQRFRRSEWKQKAEEALTRHGIPIPTEEIEEHRDKASSSSRATEMEAEPPIATHSAETEVESEPEAGDETNDAGEAEQETPRETAAPAEAGAGRRRRRRRGGRGRRRGRGRKEGAEEGARPRPEPSAPAAAGEHAHVATRPPVSAPPPRVREREREPEPRPAPERRAHREQLPAIHVYRRGEPALASEIKALEAKLRQLLASHPYSLDQLHEAPASPGVYLVSDLDLTTMYYLETCRSMRSGMEQLVSGRRGRQGSVRARLATFLGINDSQASRYLKQHCAVRWIELEDADAVALGHFATALLRPELMDESD